jgi:hypothetical protein
MLDIAGLEALAGVGFTLAGRPLICYRPLPLPFPVAVWEHLVPCLVLEVLSALFFSRLFQRLLTKFAT